MFFARLYKFFFSKEVIAVYICDKCSNLRTELEWKKFGIRNCLKCGGNRIREIYPNRWGRFKLWVRYLARGY